MTNLTEKLDELQLQSAAQHAEVLAALAALNTAVSTPPETPVPGFAEVVSAIGTGNALLTLIRTATSQVQSNTATANTRLLDIFNRLGDIATYQVSMQEDIGLIQETVGLKEAGAEFTLASLVRAISMASANIANSTGLLPTPAAGTILELLGQQASKDPCGCGRPAPGDFDCTAPYTSTAQRVLPWSLIGGTNQLFAVFPDPPPSGIAFGTIFGFGTDYAELESTDWSQWRVYVQSTEPTYSDGTDATVRFPTNQWNAMTGSGSRAFAVSDRGDIIVTLCNVGDFASTPVPPGECITMQADEAVGGNQQITLSGYPDTYSVTATDNFYIYYGETYGGGPFAAGTAWSFSEFASQPVSLRFGSSPSDPIVEVTICNPPEV